MRTSRSVLALAMWLSACGSQTTLDVNPPRVVRRDAAIGYAKDGSTDSSATASDAGDANVETDAGADAETDAGFDAGTDAGFDAGTDAGFDAGMDAGSDAGSCVPAGYAPAVTYPYDNPSSSHPTWVVTGDFDHDGFDDFAAAGGFQYSIGVYFNRGDGTFGPEVTVGSGPWPNQIIASDIDGDGFLDLAVADGLPSCGRTCCPAGCDSNIAIARNLHNRSFAAPTFVSTGGLFANAVAAGDLNGDGRVDLVATNYNSSTIAVMLQLPSGTFRAATTYALNEAASIVLGDLDRNGSLDVVAGARSWNSAQFATFFNDGSGTLAVGATYTYGPFDNTRYQATPALAIGNFAGSGNMDVFISDDRGAQAVLYANDGRGGFGTPSTFSVGSPHWFAASDVDGDGALDLAMTTTEVTSTTFVDEVAVLRNLGGGLFASPATYPELLPWGIAAGNFNHDGIADFAVGNASWVSVLLSKCR